MTRTALCLALTFGLFVSPLSAAIIPVESDETFQDGPGGPDANGTGDTVATFDPLVVGPRDGTPSDSSTFPLEEEFRAGVRFDISGAGSDIDNAATIFLDITTRSVSDNFTSGTPSFDIDVFGLADASSTFSVSDFQASATLVNTIANSAITADTLLSVDVTDFVQDAKDDGDSFVAFRLQAATFAGTPDTSSGLIVYRFESADTSSGDPQLRTIPIPEPAGAMLIGVGGLILLGRRRASDRR